MTGYRLCHIRAKEVEYLDDTHFFSSKGELFPALLIDCCFTDHAYTPYTWSLTPMVSYYLVFAKTLSGYLSTVDRSYSLEMNNIEVENVFKGLPLSPSDIESYLARYPLSKNIPQLHFDKSSEGLIIEDTPFSVGSHYYPPNRMGAFYVAGIVLAFDNRPSFQFATYYSNDKSGLQYSLFHHREKCCLRCEDSYYANTPEHDFFVSLGGIYENRYPFLTSYFSSFLFGVYNQLKFNFSTMNDWNFETFNGLYYFDIRDVTSHAVMTLTLSSTASDFKDFLRQRFHFTTFSNDLKSFFVDLRSVLGSLEIVYSNDVFVINYLQNLIRQYFGRNDLILNASPNNSTNRFKVNDDGNVHWFKPVFNSYKNSNTYQKEI